MESVQPNQPLLPLTNYSPDYLKSEDTPLPLRPRQPLSDLVGNAQPQTLPLTSYHDSKGSQPGCQIALFSLPTLPSQPQDATDLSHQFDHHHRNRDRHRDRHSHNHKRARGPVRLSRNPIVDSPQYRAYRERQPKARKTTNKKNEEPDSKWPDVLEDAFLDALINIPQMQRRKYSFNGKLHGRNELIAKYLWFAYEESLPPGAPVDLDMERSRKQVSSHIQVLKGFLRDHPAKDILFPPTMKGRPVAQESFTHDSCLKGLSEGRLPGKQYRSRHQKSEIRPLMFSLILTADEDDRGVDMDARILHQFSRLLPRPNKPMSLDLIRHWRTRFPHLLQFQTHNASTCPIIHMKVFLELLTLPPPQYTHLLSQTKLAIPTTAESQSCKWQSVATLDLPQELCSNATYDGRLKYPPVNQMVFSARAESVLEAETIIAVQFPAAQFAYAFTTLVSLKEQFDYGLKASGYDEDADSSARPARDYVEKMTMYQELQSQSAPGQPFVTRAILLWTFHEANMNSPSNTTWGYLDPAPPQRTVMSHSPHPMHYQPTNMLERCKNWPESQMMMHSNDVVDSYGHGLATPPHPVDLQSPYGSDVAYSFPQQQQPYDMQNENLSFISSNTLDSDSKLVDDTAANIESILSNANANANLMEYEQNAGNWQLPMPPGDSFDQDPMWVNANYAVPASTPVVGCCAEQHVVQSWSESKLQDVKPLLWVDETTPQHLEHENDHVIWNGNSPMHKLVNFEQPQTIETIEQSLMPWTRKHYEHVVGNAYAFEPVPERSVEDGEMRIEITMGDELNIHIQQETIDNTMVDSQNLKDHTLDSHLEEHALEG